MNAEKLRKDFPVLERKINGKPIIYLDNAATSLKPMQVIEAMDYYYKNATANIHRGIHRLSEEASELYEKSHENIAKFIGAKKEEFIFYNNTTEAINSVMYSLLLQDYFKEGDEVLLTEMEHHANLVPWQVLNKHKKLKLNFVKLKEDFTLDMQDLQKKISKKTRLVAVAHASNTVATINPVKEIARIARDFNALCLIDGAQSVPHFEVNVKNLGCDFFAFSGHKMLGPTGSGGLYARKELLEEMPPFLYGGSMIKSVKWNESSWNELPWRFEAGTPNIAGCIGLGAAVDYLKKAGMNEVREHEKILLDYAFKRIQEINSGNKIKIYNPNNPEKQVGVILFEAKGIECHDLALALDEHSNIAIRSGMHCAEPLVSSFNPKGLDRASFYLYNTKQEIDAFIEALEEIIKTFS